MKNKLKKIFTTTLVSAATIAAVGCGSPNAKLAKNIDKGMADFVTSINNLDYVETSTTEVNSDNSIGKIIETTANTLDDQYLTQTLEELNIENNITIPNDRTDNFKLYVLSSMPFISFSSNDNAASLNMQLNFSTEKIEETSSEINDKVNNLILKRSILMIYVNEIYNNRVDLSEENRIAINAYVNVIKENASFLNGNRGMVKNQLSLANDLAHNNSNNNLINYYIIKSGEALENRSSKIDSTISAIDSIINIIESNLTPSSIYYSNSLSSTYENLLSNVNNSNNSNSTIENKELADNISNSLQFSNSNININNSKTLPEFRLSDQNSSSLIKNTLNNKSASTQSAKQIQNSLNNKTKNLYTNQITDNNDLKSKESTSKLNSEKSTSKNPSTSRTLEMRNNKKSANLQQIQNNNNQNNINEQNYSNIEHVYTPKTLDLPQTENIYNPSNIDDSKSINNNLQRKTNNEKSSSNKTVKQNNKQSNITRHHSHENIKRVPYVRNFD